MLISGVRTTPTAASSRRTRHVGYFPAVRTSVGQPVSGHVCVPVAHGAPVLFLGVMDCGGKGADPGPIRLTRAAVGSTQHAISHAHFIAGTRGVNGRRPGKWRESAIG